MEDHHRMSVYSSLLMVYGLCHSMLVYGVVETSITRKFNHRMLVYGLWFMVYDMVC